MSHTSHNSRGFMGFLAFLVAVLLLGWVVVVLGSAGRSLLLSAWHSLDPLLARYGLLGWVGLAALLVLAWTAISGPFQRTGKRDSGEGYHLDD